MIRSDLVPYEGENPNGLREGERCSFCESGALISWRHEREPGCDECERGCDEREPGRPGAGPGRVDPGDHRDRPAATGHRGRVRAVAARGRSRDGDGLLGDLPVLPEPG